MSYADEVFIKDCRDILENGFWDTEQDVRPRWEDNNAPAHTIKKFGIVNRYDLRGEFPILTIRRTYWKSAIDELLWIWQKKSNNIKDLGSHVWDPDVIIFAPDTIYDTVATDTAWQQLSAISGGNYYKTPYGPYGWLSSPPSVQRYLGMLWLGALLYPDYCEYDLQTEVTEYYELFYQCELTQEMYDNLMAGAMPEE